MNQYSVLVLFKDNLIIGGEDEFPITLKSETIRLHQQMSEIISKEEQKNKKQSFIHFKGNSNLRNLDVKEINHENFVWGWWKKPGESHNKIFKIIHDICKEKGSVNTLLYNRYMRRIYTAEITDIYFVPFASTVSIPEKWKWKCPGYYKNLPHFCGAYFSMKLRTEPNISQNKKNINDYEEYSNELIIPCEDPQFVLNKYFVDRNTFDDFFMAGISVIKQPKEIINASKEIIDKPISTLSLKLTDQTIFLIRKSTKKEKIRELFNIGQDNEISNELKNFPTDEAIEFIREMTREDWKKLSVLKNSIIAINGLFKIKDMPITTTDIRLVSALIKEKVLSDDDIEKISDRENFIIEWLLSKDIKNQRENASRFFSLVWKFSIKEIKMTGMEEYFSILPQLEEISSSTKQIKKKLYRDHLNHNIRAALMSSYLVSIFENDNENMRLAFYSGLLHDIAHPLSSYEGTIQSIQEGLKKLEITKSSATDSIIDKDKLKNLVNIVAFLASIPNIKHEKEISESWTDLKKMFHIIRPELLYEEIMCSMSYEHSFLSAAVVFNTAANGVLNENAKFYDRVKHLFGNKEHYKDLFQIIQCIALHDRKAVSNYWGLSNFQDIAMNDFFLPVITIIADEIQEWGRPISSNEKSIVTDCNIEYNNKETFTVKYTCNFREEILKGIEYCFLEHFFSKDRIFFRLRNNKGNNFKLELQMDIRGELKIYTSSNYSNELTLIQDENDVLWPENIEWHGKIKEEDDKRLIALISYPSDKKSLVSSFIIFESKQKGIINELKKDLSMNFSKIRNMILSRDACKLEINGKIIEGNVRSYYFTTYQKNSVVIIPDNYEVDNYKIIDKIGILILENVLINGVEEPQFQQIQVEYNNMHLFPQPHFLDLDWRFNYQSINSILNFISVNINKGKVCYLGCPSLALYHNRQISSMNTEFILFDKGHYALNKWLQAGYIDKNNFVEYDVQKIIPDEYLNQYDIVIMDSPWYKEFYELFLKRAISLVKNKGIIGIAEYPGYPGHKEKVDYFKKTKEKVFKKSVNFSPYCSIEVAYAEPDFEKIWQGHKEFVHSAINAYRPAYMDFYLINNPDYINDKDETLSIYNSTNDINIEYSSRYVRLKKDYKDYLNNNYHWVFTTRTSLSRNIKEQWIGWSTNNTIISVDIDKKQKGYVIENQEELIFRLTEYENLYLPQSVS